MICKNRKPKIKKKREIHLYRKNQQIIKSKKKIYKIILTNLSKKRIIKIQIKNLIVNNNHLQIQNLVI